MVFTHEIDAADGGSTLTHTVAIEGPLSPLFSWVIGRKVAAELPASMKRLAELSARS